MNFTHASTNGLGCIALGAALFLVGLVVNLKLRNAQEGIGGVPLHIRVPKNTLEVNRQFGA